VIVQVGWNETYAYAWFKSGRRKRAQISLQPRHGHYSFTVVRDPLARFVSGFTEVEYRRRTFRVNGTATNTKNNTTTGSSSSGKVEGLDMGSASAPTRARADGSAAETDGRRSSRSKNSKSGKKNNNYALREASTLDTNARRRHWEELPNATTPAVNVVRLETFILWMLRYEGSHSLMRECPECDHVAPQVGTLVAAQIFEADLHVFKLEALNASWPLIAEGSGFPKDT